MKAGSTDLRRFMDKKLHINFWYVIAAMLGIVLFQSFLVEYLQGSKPVPIPYSRFESLLNDGKIADISMTPNYIHGTLREPQSDGLKDFITTRVEPDLADRLDKHGVTYKGVIESTWLRDLLSWIVPAVFFVAIWMFAIRRMGQGGLGGLMAIGKSRAKVYVDCGRVPNFRQSPRAPPPGAARSQALSASTDDTPRTS
jgi:cell division protease FtsH